MLTELLFDIPRTIFSCFSQESYYSVNGYDFPSVFLLVLHLMCLKNETLMNEDYLL